jgi:hypothetical protein
MTRDSVLAAELLVDAVDRPEEGAERVAEKRGRATERRG